jgi:thiamine transport system substrate-binding protein
MNLALCLILTALSSQAIAGEKPSLRIYTYDSFASEWGPGPTIKKEFEKECACEVKFISVADGYALLARLKLEKSSPKADLIVGLDETLTTAALETGLFTPSEVRIENLNIPKPLKTSPIFVPYDYGSYAFMFDTQAKNSKGQLFTRPTSMAELLTDPNLRKSIIIQDPRSSAPGFALLLWLRSLYQDRTAEKYLELKKQVLTVSPGWSESYKLFTSGEAPIVFSYTTSEAYHREEEKTDRYQTIIFKEGHYAVVEYSALLKSSKHHALGQKFLKFLTSTSTQATIASKNWMYPIRALPTGLPKSYSQIPVPGHVLRISPSEILKQRGSWIHEWQTIFSKN